MTANDRSSIAFSRAGKDTVTHVFYTHVGVLRIHGDLVRCYRCGGPAIAIDGQHILAIPTPHGQEFLCGYCVALEEDRP